MHHKNSTRIKYVIKITQECVQSSTSVNTYNTIMLIYLKCLTVEPGVATFFSPHGIDVPRIVIAKLTEQFQVKERCRDGVACVVFL